MIKKLDEHNYTNIDVAQFKKTAVPASSPDTLLEQDDLEETLALWHRDAWHQYWQNAA